MGDGDRNWEEGGGTKVVRKGKRERVEERQRQRVRDRH